MFSLYRYYAAGEQLLYVGATHNPFRREAQHRKVRDMREVTHIELEWFDTEEEVFAAEALAIRREGPTWNVIGKGKSRKRARTRLSKMPPSLKRKTRREDGKGGNVRYRQPTDDEIAVIVSYWHGTMKPREFMPLIRKMMGEPDLPDTWARDLVKKWTGNTKRDPNAPGKKPLPPIESDDT